MYKVQLTSASLKRKPYRTCSQANSYSSRPTHSPPVSHTWSIWFGICAALITSKISSSVTESFSHQKTERRGSFWQLGYSSYFFPALFASRANLSANPSSAVFRLWRDSTGSRSHNDRRFTEGRTPFAGFGSSISLGSRGRNLHLIGFRLPIPPGDLALSILVIIKRAIWSPNPFTWPFFFPRRSSAWKPNW